MNERNRAFFIFVCFYFCDVISRGPLTVPFSVYLDHVTDSSQLM